jgi:hypothetical protein
MERKDEGRSETWRTGGGGVLGTQEVANAIDPENKETFQTENRRTKLRVVCPRPEREFPTGRRAKLGHDALPIEEVFTSDVPGDTEVLGDREAEVHGDRVGLETAVLGTGGRRLTRGRDHGREV